VVDVVAMAERLDRAARGAAPIGPLTATTTLDERSAYAVQAALVERRLARGEHIIGLKMGFTSAAMRRQMGVEQPNCGWLTDAMVIADGAMLPLEGRIHPRVEPEVAFRLARDLSAEEPLATLAEAVAEAAPALEVVDSRFRDYRFTLFDNTADNSSASGVVLGPWRAVQDVDRLAVSLSVNGAVVHSGLTSDVMGGPLRSLALAAGMAAKLSRPLRAGMIVITGGVTPAVALTPGAEILAVFETLGRVSLRTPP
jgi:2-oxo-3-hexenedioate decarboxylase